MEIKSKILAVLRVINVILDELKNPDWLQPNNVDDSDLYYDKDKHKYKRAKEYDYLVKLLRKNNIGKEDYPVLKNILQSMALMTTGAVHVIRNPSTYSPDDAKEWNMYFKSNTHFEKLLQEIGIDLQDKPTKQDYELAQKMVKSLGSSFVDEKEVRNIFFASGIEQEFGMNKTAAARRNIQGAKTLYRGLHSLSEDAYKLATTIGEQWDLERGVSTSMMIEIAENFAMEGSGLSNEHLIFIINNPKRKGFVADKLSHFDESEVILSGRLKITKVDPPSDDNDYHTLVYADLL